MERDIKILEEVYIQVLKIETFVLLSFSKIFLVTSRFRNMCFSHYFFYKYIVSFSQAKTKHLTLKLSNTKVEV